MPFITGTRAYGPAREDSDYDIVMDDRDAWMLRQILLQCGIVITDPENEEYTSGWCFECQGKKIQVITAYDDDEFAAWKYATQKMKKHQKIEDRDDRVEQFQKYWEEYMNLMKL